MLCVSVIRDDIHAVDGFSMLGLAPPPSPSAPYSQIRQLVIMVIYTDHSLCKAGLSCSFPRGRINAPILHTVNRIHISLRSAIKSCIEALSRK